MIEIPVRHGKILLDDQDYEWIIPGYWLKSALSGTTSRRTGPNPSPDVSAVATPRREKEKNPPSVLLGRLILKPPRHLVVNHINHDPLDNRRENLRAVTRGHVSMYSRRSSHVSGYKGVYIRKGARGRVYYRSKIHFGGKRYELRQHKIPEIPALEYNRAAFLLYREQLSVNRVYCVSDSPQPADGPCQVCQAPCYCCCVCSSELPAGLERLLSDRGLHPGASTLT